MELQISRSTALIGKYMKSLSTEELKEHKVSPDDDRIEGFHRVFANNKKGLW